MKSKLDESTFIRKALILPEPAKTPYPGALPLCFEYNKSTKSIHLITVYDDKCGGKKKGEKKKTRKLERNKLSST